MASVSESPNGTRRILFADSNGKRQTLYLGTMPHKAALTIKGHVEQIVNAAIARAALPRETAVWLAEIGDTLRAKLANLRLVEDKAEPARIPTVADQAWAYLAKRTDLKAGTLFNIDAAADSLIEFAGTTKRLDTFTKGDGVAFKRWLDARYASATVGRRIGYTIAEGVPACGMESWTWHIQAWCGQ